MGSIIRQARQTSLLWTVACEVQGFHFQRLRPTSRDQPVRVKCEARRLQDLEEQLS